VLASKLLHDLVPVVVREHSLGIQLVWDSLDRNLHFGDYRVVVELRVTPKRRPHGANRWVLKEQQDSFERPCGGVQVDVPSHVSLVERKLPVALYARIEHHCLAHILLTFSPRQVRIGNHIELERYIYDLVRRGRIGRHNDTAIVVEGELETQPVV